MIESLILKGFQCHQQIVVKFDNITTIIGKNDIGKSAIIRALYWLAFNRPSGDSIRNWDASKVFAKLKVDGQIIIRRKGKQNLYLLDGEPYKAFGTGVPQDIQNILNMSSVNFQHQKEAPFWISLSPSQVSKELNKIVDLEVIDTSLSNVANGLRKAKAKTELIEERIKEARQKKKELAWVKESHKQLSKLERNQEKLAALTSKATLLRSYIDDISNVKRDVVGLTKLARRARRIAKTASKTVAMQKRYDQLKELIEEIKHEEDEICLNRMYLKKINQQLGSIRICPTCGNKMM